jgi:hypothetical protein
MELTTIFALFCGTIITIHFIDTLSEKVRSKKRNKLSKTVRKSWYCFFTPERLLGEQSDSKVMEYQDNRQDKTKENRRRAQEEQRRRLVLRP